MRIGDVVVFRNFVSRVEIVGRVTKYSGGLYGVAEARGAVSWRTESELSKLAADDPRAAGLPGFAPAAKPKVEAEPRGRGRPATPVSDRICAALARGFETSPSIAHHLGLEANVVAERMNDLERRGRVERIGYALRHRACPPTLRWRLKAGAEAEAVAS